MFFNVREALKAQEFPVNLDLSHGASQTPDFGGLRQRGKSFVYRKEKLRASSTAPRCRAVRIGYYIIRTARNRALPSTTRS